MIAFSVAVALAIDPGLDIDIYLCMDIGLRRALLFAMLPGHEIMVVLAPFVAVIVANVNVIVHIVVGVGAPEFHCISVLDTWPYQSQT